LHVSTAQRPAWHATLALLKAPQAWPHSPQSLIDVSRVSQVPSPSQSARSLAHVAEVQRPPEQLSPAPHG